MEAQIPIAPRHWATGRAAAGVVRPHGGALFGTTVVPEHLKNEHAFRNRLPYEQVAAYTHDTVREPVADMIRLGTPDELGGCSLAELGLVDVTHPFFGADSSGECDSTAAIQRAVEFARDHQMVCFFPVGTYLVSDTITCVQNLYLPAHGENYQTADGCVTWARNFPCVLMGSREDAGRRPVIRLAPHSPGFGNPEKRKRVFWFWARSLSDPLREQANIAMNNLFVGIDIDIGEGNAGAVGIRMRAAQGSGVLHCRIDATHGAVGLEGGAGSGGSHAGLTVVGGRVGIDMRESQPCPTLTDVALLRQTQCGLQYRGMQSLTAVGIRVESETADPLIACSTSAEGPLHGQLSLIDSVLIGRGVGIRSGRGVYLQDVFTRGLRDVIAFTDGTAVHGGGEAWVHVRECAWSPPLPPLRATNGDEINYASGVWIDGVHHEGPHIVLGPSSSPPDGLLAQHRLPAVPDWRDGANVRDYGAAGDGIHDDRTALQRAIDENDVVFLPRSLYRISDTLHLRPDTAMVGLGCAFSVIIIRGDETAFSHSGQPRPLIATADDPEATTLFAFCGAMVPFRAIQAVAMDWRCGRRSAAIMPRFFLHSVLGYEAESAVEGRQAPLVRVTGHGGGRWFSYYEEHDSRIGRDYRHLLVDGARGPFAIYHCNAEHAHSDANMEIRNASHVTLYNFKGEFNEVMLWVRDSDHVRLYGYGGNGAAYEGKHLIRFERTPNFVCTNLVDQSRLPGNGVVGEGTFGGGVDPRRWTMLSDWPTDGAHIETPPLERPVLYKRGHPNLGCEATD